MHQNDIELETLLPHERNVFQKTQSRETFKVKFQRLVVKGFKLT